MDQLGVYVPSFDSLMETLLKQMPQKIKKNILTAAMLDC